MAFGLAVATTVHPPRRALAASLPVLLLLAIAAAVMLATGPSTGQFHIPNLEKQSDETQIRHEANKIETVVRRGTSQWPEKSKELTRLSLEKGEAGLKEIILGIGKHTGLLDENPAFQQSVVEALLGSDFGEKANALFPEVEAAMAVKKSVLEVKTWPRFQDWFIHNLEEGEAGVKAIILGILQARGSKFKGKSPEFYQSVVDYLVGSGFGELAHAEFPEVEAAMAVKKSALEVKTWPHFQNWFIRNLEEGDAGVKAIILGILRGAGGKKKNPEFEQSVVDYLVGSGFGELAHAQFPDVRVRMAEAEAAAVAAAAESVRTLTSKVKTQKPFIQKWFKGCLWKGDAGIMEIINGEYMAVPEYKTFGTDVKQKVVELLVASDFGELAHAQYPEIKALNGHDQCEAFGGISPMASIFPASYTRERNLCCPKACGRCGGHGCSTLNGGKDLCCIGGILGHAQTCTRNDADKTVETQGCIQSECLRGACSKEEIDLHALAAIVKAYEDLEI
jgi:hypothetical protein